MSDIIRELAEARARAGLTQAKLAQKLGVLQSRVSRFEHESNPRLDTLQSYARTLDLELILVPRKELSRVCAVLRREWAPTDEGDRPSRFPTLEDLIARASRETEKPPRRRGSGR